MYFIPDKDMIEDSVIVHLPFLNRSYVTTVCFLLIVNAILYKLKTSVHYRILPVNALFSDKVLCW